MLEVENLQKTGQNFENAQKLPYKTTLTAIRKARRFAVQGLYEWLLSKNSAYAIEAHTREQNAMHTVHLGYYHELLSKIIEQNEQLIDFIDKNLDRPWIRLDKVEQAVLLIGLYELKYRLEIPYKVVIDEAIQLNTHFGSSDGYKLIHVVMDKLAKQLRDPEVQADLRKSQTKPES
ncbi:NusB antitermination factor [Moraxella macacae 0408225]|uniref:Transcription antitermination protein NusB n=1 Tax=Moraxella macacae 0408225 TaxID=1230338 RepID=L2F8U9_9GAMM|nr:transcription antitermination factor NusB [Moraxella macacae]ELA09489.1 NusB antitermination factor [Moraxella macacae 0408225]